ncbi:MAG: hypothetical protein GY846_15970 [Deltaproteobacteria bacterium]|nr:hypothetical protein [Deltaproteobacteria bacterium]
MNLRKKFEKEHQHSYGSTQAAKIAFSPLRGGFLIPRPMGVVGDLLRKLLRTARPVNYLGNVPFLSAGNICKHPDDMTRTHVALMNPYVHDAMARAMFKAEDDFRERGYLGTLLFPAGSCLNPDVRAVTSCAVMIATGVMSAMHNVFSKMMFSSKDMWRHASASQGNPCTRADVNKLFPPMSLGFHPFLSQLLYSGRVSFISS